MIKKSKVSEEHKKKTPKINLALIIVNTDHYRALKSKEKTSDKIIPKVERMLISNQSISLAFSEIITDSQEHINKVLVELMKDDKIDSIIFSGGMGFSKKEITYETLEPHFEKKIDGFGEIFRYLYYNKIGTSAIHYRATAGILRSKKKAKTIFLVPGSPDAVKLALEHIIIPEIEQFSNNINKEG